MKNEVMTITPEQAKKFLSKMKVNRPCSNHVVNAYSQSLLRGEWVLNGESIKFDSNGSLVDGQHRLNAIIASNNPMKTLVTYGVSVDAFKSLDQGKNRTNADIIYIDDNEYASIKASVASNIMKYKNGLMKHRRKSDRTEVLRFYNLHKENIKSSIKFIASVKKDNYPAGFAIMAFCHFIFRHVNFVKADEFISRLISGEGLSSKDVIYMLRERLIKNRLSTVKRNIFYQCELIFRAFNYYYKDQNVQSLKWGSSDSEIIKF